MGVGWGWDSPFLPADFESACGLQPSGRERLLQRWAAGKKKGEGKLSTLNAISVTPHPPGPEGPLGGQALEAPWPGLQEVCAEPGPVTHGQRCAGGRGEACCFS